MRIGISVAFCTSIFLIGCSGGTSSSSSGTPSLLQAPVANAGGPYTGTAGTVITFSGSGSSDPQSQALTYAWNFGDSMTGTGVSSGHPYATAGAYTVSLTVTDTSGLSSVATSKVTVSAAQQSPVASAGGPYTGTVGTAISFNGNGSSDPQGQVLTYAWNFGDNSTGTGVNPTHIYAVAGTYNVSVAVTDTSSLSSTATSKASIVAAPQIQSISVTPSSPSSLVGATLQFTATATLSDGSTKNVSTSATWASLNTAVATVSNGSGTQGLASSVAVGTSTISASTGSVTGSTTLTVTSATSAVESWNGYLNSSNGVTSSIAATLAQSGTTISGQVQISGNPAFDATTPFAVSGTISPAGILSLTGTQNQTTFTYSGSISLDQSNSSGTYTVTGTSSENGNATLLHPPIVSGTYSGTFAGGDNGTTTLSLSLTPVTTPGSSSIGLTGTGTVNGLQLLCGVAPSFTFSGTQIGTLVTGQLIQNGRIWAQLGGYTGSNGSTLTGHAVLTQGVCSDITTNGTLTNPNVPGGVVYPSGNVGAVTVIVENIGVGTGMVYVGAQEVSCPGAPTPFPISPVTCGTAVFPDGTNAILFDAIATPTQNPVTYVSPFGPCGIGGSMLPLTAWSCYDPLYNVPQSGTTILFRIAFGNYGHQNPVLNP